MRRQLRRSTWAPTTTATATARSTPTRCATSPARARPSYVTRITSTLRSTIRDANTHFVSVEQQLRLHPVRRHAPDLHRRHRQRRPVRRHDRHRARRATRRSPDGKNPIWNQYGHERMGWALSISNPADALTARSASHGRAASSWPEAEPIRLAAAEPWRPSLGYLGPGIRAGGRRALAYGLLSSSTPAADAERHRLAAPPHIASARRVRAGSPRSPAASAAPTRHRAAPASGAGIAAAPAADCAHARSERRSDARPFRLRERRRATDDGAR